MCSLKLFRGLWDIFCIKQHINTHRHGPNVIIHLYLWVLINNKLSYVHNFIFHYLPVSSKRWLSSTDFSHPRIKINKSRNYWLKMYTFCDWIHTFIIICSRWDHKNIQINEHNLSSPHQQVGRWLGQTSHGWSGLGAPQDEPISDSFQRDTWTACPLLSHTRRGLESLKRQKI